MNTLITMFCGLLFTTLNPSANATAFEAEVLDETRIVKIERSTTGAQPSLIYLEDGRLLRIDPSNKATLRRLQQIAQSGDSIRFTADQIGRYHQISQLKVVPTPATTIRLNDLSSRSKVNPTYTPTDLRTRSNANTEFRKLTWNLRRRSQCYQRAENWVYEMWTSSQIYSMKIFIFYTRKYINDYDFNWWFHVSPYVLAGGVEYTMDRTFNNSTRNIQEWTWEFVPRNINCALVTKYSDYENHQTEEYCYHIKVPMYYYQPRDVSNMERGKFATDFAPWELAHAREAYY